jgi:hypothetical protein
VSVFVARTSSLSPRRSDSQVPSPPPMVPNAASGPRLAPPASDTAETATVIVGLAPLFGVVLAFASLAFLGCSRTS